MMYAPICVKRQWWTMTNQQLHADNRQREAMAQRIADMHRQASRRRL